METMNFLTRVSLKNPVAIFILAFLLIAGGTYAFQSLKVDLLPDIEFPQITVESIYPGASSQDVDKQVTAKLEQKFKGLDDLEKMTSQSFESISLIQLSFPLGTNMDQVQQKVDDLLNDVQLPENVEPKLSRLSFGSFPVVNASVFAKGDQDPQAVLTEKIKPELEKIPGVNSVAVGGTVDSYVDIQVDKAKAQQLGLSLNKIQELIKSKFLSMPAGTVVNDSILIPVRIEEKIDTIAGLQNLKLELASPAAPGGAPGVAPAPAPTLFLKDVAVIKTMESKPEITRFNDKEAIALTVTKKQDANTVEVSEKALAILDKYNNEIEYAIVFEQASGITQSVETLVREGLLGALFASLAVLLFLRNIRATIIAVLSIPLSLLVSSIFLAQAGITLNIMTLGGMAVAVGRVVDDSIVVIENIFRRMKHNEEGLDRTQLTAAATREMLRAITSSTLTTIVVFLPLGLVGGVTGAFFLPFALTVVFSLIASLIVSVTLTPVLAKYSFANVKHEEKVGRLQLFYAAMIEKSLRKKGLVLLLSFALFAGSLALVPQLGFVFLPNEKQKLISATIKLPASTVIEKTNDVSLQIEKALKENENVTKVFAGVGSRDYMTGLKRENTASYFVELTETADVQTEVEAIEQKMTAIATAASNKAIVSVQEVQAGGPPSNNNIDIDLYAADTNKLFEASKLVEERMKTREELKYVTNNMQEKTKQWLVQINPERAADYGVAAFTVLGITADQTRPVSVGTFELDGKDQAVRLTYDKPLASKSELEELTLFGTKGPVKLKEIASVQEVEAVSAIQKLDGKVYARVSAQIVADNIQQVTADVKQDIADNVKLPAGVTTETGGGSDETVQTFIDLLIAMGVAIGLVYLTMLFTFGQARVPFIILSSLLFVPTGAIVGLFIANEPLSVSAMIGVLMLIGIVVTNAIVLVDRVNQNRLDGMPIRDSLIEAGKTRLRPILMTAFATICALIPLAFTTAEGSLISKGLALVVIGGLTTSTLLTLIIVPVLYELFFFRQHRKEQQQLHR